MAFKGKTYALGSFGWFYIIHLSPSLIVEKFKVVSEEDKTEDLYSANEKAWLVVCGDALLLIKLEAGGKISLDAIQFMAFKLDSLDVVTNYGLPDGWIIGTSLSALTCDVRRCHA